MLTCAAPQAAAEVDFTFDVDTITALVGQLSDAHREALYQRLGVRPAPKPRTAKAEPESYVPSTGDPRLDAFMLQHHDPAWKPLKAKAPPRPRGLHPSTATEFERTAAVRWRERGYTVEHDEHGWKVLGDGDGSYQRQMSAAYVQTRGGWKHPDDVPAGAR